MNSYIGIDYKNTVSDHPEVTNIHGKPTTQALLNLQKEIRANAVSVHTALGGGKYGHLGLVCEVEVYADINDTSPYVRPTNPEVI